MRHFFNATAWKLSLSFVRHSQCRGISSRDIRQIANFDDAFITGINAEIFDRNHSPRSLTEIIVIARPLKASRGDLRSRSIGGVDL
jgi:hypothetical protein